MSKEEYVVPRKFLLQRAMWVKEWQFQVPQLPCSSCGAPMLGEFVNLLGQGPPGPLCKVCGFANHLRLYAYFVLGNGGPSEN